MHRAAMYAVAMSVAASAPVAAQTVDLTSPPAAAIAEPFTRISGVRELPGNRAIVIDVAERTLQLADFAKGSVASLARRGNGPGEYQMPAVIFAAPNGASWLSDPQLAKVHVIGPDGKIGATLYIPGRDGPDDVLYPRGVDRLGRLYFESFGAPGPTTPDLVPVVRWSRNGKRTDTMTFVPNGVIVAGAAGARRQLFPKRDGWAVLPDGRVALIHAEPYRVDIVTGPGRVTRGPVVSYAPVRVGPAERDAYREALRAGAVSAGQSGVRVGGSMSGGSRPPTQPDILDDDFPATMPPFDASGIRVTPEGEIWVPRHRAANDHTPTYDIFDGNGRRVGQARLRDHSSVVAFGAGTVYVARRDPDDDFRYLERYARPAVAAPGRHPT